MQSDFYLRRPHTNYSPRRLVESGETTERPKTTATSRHLLRNCLSKQSLRPATSTVDLLRSKLSQPSYDFLPAVEFPSPSSSAFEISLQLPRVSTSGFLSSLTVSENERLERQQFALESNKFSSIRPTERQEYTVRTKMPSEQDFKLLQDRLEQIISNKGFTQKKSQLKEDKEFESLLPAKEQQFFRVVVRGKPTPLRVMIKRSRGKLHIYSSKTNSEPSEVSRDEQHKSDRFTLGDTGSKFKLEQVYLGLQAVEDCFYSIRIAFGRGASSKVLSRNDSMLGLKVEESIDNFARQELEKRVEEAIMRRAYEAKHAVPDKNFISSNIRLAANVPTLRRQVMSARIITHQERRERAQSKKKELLSLKRVKTINSLNRHIIRMQEEKKAKELMNLMHLKQRWQQLWLAPIVVAKGLTVMHANFLESKRQFLESKKRNLSVMRIQLMFRRWKGLLASDELCIMRAVDSLTFYSVHTKQLQVRLAHKQIRLCMSESAANFALPRSFETFFSKGEI